MQIGKVEFEIDGGAMMRVTIQYINIPYTNNIFRLTTGSRTSASPYFGTEGASSFSFAM